MQTRTVLLIGLGLGAAVVVIYAARRAAGAASDLAGQAWSAAEDAAWAVTPWNNQNVISQGVNNALFPAGDRTIGTWLYDLVNGDEWARINKPAPQPEPWSTGGGKWNNPSAYTPPGTTGSGGAAFGIYPRAF